jgi:hypothetical protein
MHNALLLREFAGENAVLPREIAQHNVFKRIYSQLQVWAAGEIPYAKDAYRKFGNLLTQLPTKIVHNQTSPLGIG